MKDTLILIFRIATVIFALIGLFLTAGFVAINLGWTSNKGVLDNSILNDQPAVDTTGAKFPATQKFVWNQDAEWSALTAAIKKDRLLIDQVATQTDSDSRLLVTMLVVEQVRLFHSERETFKQFFGPLKILGSQTQFSWGVLGIKEDTARQIEQNLIDKTSPFYLGERYEHLLDFKTTDPDSERFNRLTNDRDHYYAYLYGAIYLKQLATQWQKAGFPVSDRPEIMATLFNLGFIKSKPKASPEAGGALIDIGSTDISFGRLAYEFYYSHELGRDFPIK
jgi:hypothetical protein